MITRRAGLLLPVFSLRRRGGLGIGDTCAMREWIDLVADFGVSLIQTLPINETGSDDSPYNAISSVALEPIYLTCEDVPGIDSDLLGEKQRAHESAERVDYPAVRESKNHLLRDAWTRWPQADPARHDEFAGFRREEAAWLDDYLVFRWLMEREPMREAWDRWASDRRDPAGAHAALEAARRADPAAVANQLDYLAWIQWLCFRQWRAVRQHAERSGVQLMGDIPIGISRHSADVFFRRDDFDLDWCGGAPPETVFKHDRFIQQWGQNWGVPIYRWEKMQRDGFPWWRQRIAKLLDVFHLFRIDHVLGFYRIYGFPWTPDRNAEFLDLTREQAKKLTGGPLPRWVPRPDDTPENRAANRADGDRRLRMIQDVAGHDAVIAEDLGHVPDYVRPHLQSLDICGFRIPHWDRDKAGKVIPGDRFPETSFATYATHDHDPMTAMWEDLRRRAFQENDDPDDQKEARTLLQRLTDFAGIDHGGGYDDAIHWALIDALMASRSRYAAIMVTDLLRMPDRINQPGTVGPHNWSLYLAQTATDYRSHAAWPRFKQAICAGQRI